MKLQRSKRNLGHFLAQQFIYYCCFLLLQLNDIGLGKQVWSLSIVTKFRHICLTLCTISFSQTSERFQISKKNEIRRLKVISSVGESFCFISLENTRQKCILPFCKIFFAVHFWTLRNFFVLLILVKLSMFFFFGTFSGALCTQLTLYWFLWFFVFWCCFCSLSEI